MSLIDKTAPSQTDAIEFEIELKHPPQKVWRALTDPALLSEWLLPVVDLSLEPGAKFAFQAPPQPDWDGAVQCRCLEIERHKKLSWQWVVGALDTVVTFSLTPTGGGTRLEIVQSGFAEDQKKNFGGARYGWRMMGQRLIDLLGSVE